MRLVHRRFRLAGAIAVAVVAAGLVTAPAARAAVGCRVTYTITNQWPAGFGASVAVTNLGDLVTSWRLNWSFTAGQTITQLWGGTFGQSGAEVTVSNAAWNGALATGASATFGFNGSWNNAANPIPSSFVLNGTACSGSTPSPPASPPASPTASASGGQSASPSASPSSSSQNTSEPPNNSNATIVPDPSWTCGMPDGIAPPTRGQLVFRATVQLGAVWRAPRFPDSYILTELMR